MATSIFNLWLYKVEPAIGTRAESTRALYGVHTPNGFLDGLQRATESTCLQEALSHLDDIVDKCLNKEEMDTLAQALRSGLSNGYVVRQGTGSLEVSFGGETLLSIESKPLEQTVFYDKTLKVLYQTALFYKEKELSCVDLEPEYLVALVEALDMEKWVAKSTIIQPSQMEKLATFASEQEKGDDALTLSFIFDDSAMQAVFGEGVDVKRIAYKLSFSTQGNTIYYDGVSVERY